jgi:hypothetical protein
MCAIYLPLPLKKKLKIHQKVILKKFHPKSSSLSLGNSNEAKRLAAFLVNFLTLTEC